MAETMKAAVLQAFHTELVLENLPRPIAGQGEVLVQVKASGLCVSDIHIQEGKISTVSLPLTLGHEMAGEIVAVGEGVSPKRIGERVTAAIDIICHKCSYCLSGRTNLCPELVRIGFEANGSHAQYCVIPAQNAFPVAEHVPYTHITALPDAVGCMYNAIKNRAKLEMGQRILILGTGGLGMNAIQIAKCFGAYVYATSRKDDKLEIAKLMGADGTINTAKEDIHEAAARLTNGQGFDVVIDNIGIESSINLGIYLVRSGGKVIVSGYVDPTFSVNYQEIMKYEKEIIGMRGMTRRDLLDCIALVEQGRIVPYVYKTFPLSKVNEALELLRTGEANGRVVLDMTLEDE